MKKVSLFILSLIISATFGTNIFAQQQEMMNIHLKNGESVSYYVNEMDSIKFALEEPVPAPQIGDFYYSDGTWSSGEAEPVEAKECIGIIFHVGQHESDKSDYSETGIGKEKCNGYVVALKDATKGELVPWGPSSFDNMGFYPKDEEGNPVDNFSEGTDSDWSGFEYTQQTSKTAKEMYGLHCMSSEGFPATYFATQYYSDIAKAPAKSSGWFLPSISQLMRAFELLKTLSSSELITPLKDVVYVSSSEKYNSPRFILTGDNRGETPRINYDYKSDYEFDVRAILAF